MFVLICFCRNRFFFSIMAYVLLSFVILDRDFLMKCHKNSLEIVSNNEHICRRFHANHESGEESIVRRHIC